jgi:Na+/H+-translocating membrane pyrophosphatase
MILGATLAKTAHLDTVHSVSFMFFPLALHSLDLISSTIGLYFVKTVDSESIYLFIL